MCERCEILEEENRQLRDQLGMVAKEATRESIRLHYGLSPNSAHICALLYQKAPATVRFDTFMVSRPYQNTDELQLHTLCVFIHKIRKKLGRHAIVNDWGQGYYMTREAAEKITAAINAA